jgi:DNA-nicking Smr family endonuclease
MEKKMLGEIRDYINNFLKVDTEISQDQTLNAKYPVIIKFTVTNTYKHQEFETDVVFEEVQLKVGVPPDWHTEKATNITCGNSFGYEHHCNYDEIMKVKWAIEGRLSPAVLLTFYRSPHQVKRDNQLPIKAYFDYLTQMNIHKFLGQIRTFPAPNQNTTLAEMKSKVETLNYISSELSSSGQRLQEFLGLVNTDKYRDDINRHRATVVEYLNNTQREIGELSQLLKNRNGEGFEKARDNIVAKLTVKASELEKATEELELKLGIITKGTKDENISTVSAKVVPPAILLKEIDLHNTPNIEEAIPLLEKFIRDSYRENVRIIRIIHGKGIGVLRNSVRLHLESHKLVKNFRSADNDHGGDGATEANLVDYNTDLILPSTTKDS